MSLSAYPRYRDSAHPWLGDVPEGWQLMRVKHALTSLGSGGTPDTSNPLLWSEEAGIPWVAIGDMSSRNLIDATEKSLSPKGVESKALTVWPPGTLLFSMYASLGHVAELAIDAATNQAILALLPNQSVFQGFLKRWFESIRPNLRQEASSNTQDNLNAEKVRNLPFLLPTFSEQVAISGFLDRETAKIDALIAEQETLLTLLAEKRQTTISQAVTRGLDPDVPMKDSGIAWLGSIPEHWAVSQSRRMFAVRSEPALPTDRMLTASQKYGVLYQEDFVAREGRRVVEVIKGKESLKHVEPDDFIISMRSFQGGLEWCRLRGSTSFHYVMVTPLKFVHPPFFAHLFKSSVYIQALRATTDLIRDGQELRYSNFVMVDLPVIPLEEQMRIADFLDDALGVIDAISSATELAIHLLRERRSALITAAVTGKIDVRGQAKAQAA